MSFHLQESTLRLHSHRYERGLLSRELHNQVQELQGNIRVFCRVRPLLAGEEGSLDHMAFPDSHRDGRKLTVTSQKQDYKGTSTTKDSNFTFDRVRTHMLLLRSMRPKLLPVLTGLRPSRRPRRRL